MYAVLAVTVMRVLFYLCVSCVYVERVRGCVGEKNAGVGAGRGVVVGCEYLDVTRGSGFVSTADEEPDMSGVRGVVGVREM